MNADREQIARAIAEALNDSVNQRLAGPDMLESLPDEWSVEAQEIAAALLDGPNPLVVPIIRHLGVVREVDIAACKAGEQTADARWRADLAPLLALHQQQPCRCGTGTHDECGPCNRYWPCPTIAALPENVRPKP